MYQKLIRTKYSNKRPVEVPASDTKMMTNVYYSDLNHQRHLNRPNSSQTYAQALQQSSSPNIINMHSILQSSFDRFENLLKRQSDQIESLVKLLTNLVCKLN